MKDRITRSRQKIRASASLGYCTPLKLFPVKKEKDFKTPIIIQPISISNVAMKEEPDVQDTKYLLSRAIKGNIYQLKRDKKKHLVTYFIKSRIIESEQRFLENGIKRRCQDAYSSERLRFLFSSICLRQKAENSYAIMS